MLTVCILEMYPQSSQLQLAKWYDNVVHNVLFDDEIRHFVSIIKVEVAMYCVNHWQRNWKLNVMKCINPV